MKQDTKMFLEKFNRDIFSISAISFVALFFIELIKPKFVIAYINLNYVLLLSLLSGIFIIFFEDENEATEEDAQNKKSVGFFVLLLLSIIAFIFIMFFTWDLRVWGFLISLTGGLVVLLLELVLVDS